MDHDTKVTQFLEGLRTFPQPDDDALLEILNAVKQITDRRPDMGVREVVGAMTWATARMAEAAIKVETEGQGQA